MFEMLWKSLAIASGGWFSIGSILLVLLLLGSPKGLGKGMAYILGLCATYTAIGVAFALIRARLDLFSSSGSSTIGAVLYVLLGVLFLFFGIRKWRTPQPEEPSPPKFLSTIGELSPQKAFGIGAMIAAINFKNLAIFLSAVAALNTATLSIGLMVVCVVSIALTFCAGVLLPVLLYLLFAEGVKAFLDGVKALLEKHSHPIGITALLVFGTLFLIQGISGLL